MSPVASDFVVLGPSRRKTVRLADDFVVPVLGEGTVLVQGLKGPVLISDVLLVPDLSVRLLSVATIYDHGGHVVWGSLETDLYGADIPEPLLRCHRNGAGWYLSAPIIPVTHARADPAHCLLCGHASAVTGSGRESVPADWELWHARLGHTAPQTLAQMQRNQWVLGLTIEGEIPRSHACPGCLRGKMTQRPFPTVSYRATAPFERVHMDLMGKIEVPSARSRSRYMLLLKDEYTGYAWCYFLRKKKQTAGLIQQFFALVERQFEALIKGSSL